jgi:hypothetical protein
MAVLMPIRLPPLSTSAPPELPGLIAASLDEVLEGVDAQVRAAEPADDAHRHRLADAEGVADGEHQVAHVHALEPAEGDGGQVLQLDLQHRQVALRVHPDQLGLGLPPVVERHLDVVRGFDHVMVGEDVALRADDHARAQAGGALGFVVELVTEETAEQRVFHERMARHLHLLAGEDVHHRGHGLAGGGAEAPRHRRNRRRRLGPARLGDRDHAAVDAVALGQQVRAKRRHDEQHRQGHGGGLCEDHPELAHGSARRGLEAGGATEGHRLKKEGNYRKSART